MRIAVVGHVEWVTFACVKAVPEAGEIVHAQEVLDLPAGGGPVAAAQLAKLAGECTFFTALGDDELGHRARASMEDLGLRVEAAFHPEPQRRAFVHVDDRGERTITVLGPRLGPSADDLLPWDTLEGADAVYFCAGDLGALRKARQANVLVATSRERDTLMASDVHVDAVVGSGTDPSESFEASDLDPSPALCCWTEGDRGGRFLSADGSAGRWDPVLPRRIEDAYGAGDSFVAGLTYALGQGYGVDDALRLAARCGTACLEGRGPYEGQLTADDV